MTSTTIGARIRELRLIKGLSQRKVADHIGVSFQQLQKYESGNNRICAARLWDIAVFMKLPISDFFEAPKHDLESSKKTLELFTLIENLENPKLIYNIIKALPKKVKPSKSSNAFNSTFHKGDYYD